MPSCTTSVRARRSSRATTMPLASPISTRFAASLRPGRSAASRVPHTQRRAELRRARGRLLRSLPNRFLLQLEAKTLFACRSVDTRRYPNYVHVPLPSNPTKPHTTMRNRLETAETGARPKGPSEQGKRLLVQVGRSGRAALSTQGSAVRTRHRSLAKAAGQGRFSEVCRGPGSVRIGAVQHMCSRNDESCSTISRPASRSSAPPKTDQPSF